ncbi:MAG: VWA domain-containing protein [Crocosphaera sp.]
MSTGKQGKTFKMTDLQNFLPFIKFFNDLPTNYQIGYGILVLIFIVYTLWCLNLKYPFDFDIRNAQDNQKLKENITILLRNKRQNNNFDTDSGEYSESLYPGEHEISVKPDAFYKLVEPDNIQVSKDNKEGIIYVNILKKFVNKQDDDTQQIKPGGNSLTQTRDSNVTLYTLIEKIGKSGENKPLENLTIGNFKVIEKYDNNLHQAEIVSLRALNSSSLNIVLALDISGSMTDYIPQIQNAVKKFIETIKSIPENDQQSGKIAILRIAGESINERNFLNNHGNGQENWFKFNDPKLNQVINSIKATKENTPLYSGLILASSTLSKLDENSYNVIICLTDGKVNRGENDVKVLIQELQNKQTPVFTLGYGNDPESLYIYKLKEISKQSGAGEENIGSLVNFNIDQLENLFTKIAKSIEKAYELTWKATTSEVGKEVNVEIKIEYEGANEVPLTTTIPKSYTLKDIPEEPKGI